MEMLYVLGNPEHRRLAETHIPPEILVRLPRAAEAFTAGAG